MGWTEKNYLLFKNMPSKEIEESLSKLVNEFAEILRSRYPIFEIERGNKKYKYFKVNDSEYIRPACMFGGTGNVFHNLVIIYSDSLDSIAKNDEDEGGQFFPEDFNSKELMFAAMLEEIES